MISYLLKLMFFNTFQKATLTKRTPFTLKLQQDAIILLLLHYFLKSFFLITV